MSPMPPEGQIVECSKQLDISEHLLEADSTIESAKNGEARSHVDNIMKIPDRVNNEEPHDLIGDVEHLQYTSIPNHPLNIKLNGIPSSMASRPPESHEDASASSDAIVSLTILQ